MYSFIVIISSTNKYRKHKSSVLIWVLHNDNYTDIYDGKMANCCPKKVRGNKTNQKTKTISKTNKKEKEKKKKKKELAHAFSRKHFFPGVSPRMPESSFSPFRSVQLFIHCHGSGNLWWTSQWQAAKRIDVLYSLPPQRLCLWVLFACWTRSTQL